VRRSAARILKLRSPQGQASQLSDHRPRSGTAHDSRKSPVSQLGDCLCRKTRASLRYGSEWLGKLAEAGAPSGGVLLPAVRCLAIFAPESATGSLRGEREARRVKITLTDTVHRPDQCVCADPLRPTPQRFRTEWRLRSYSGLGIETNSSDDHCYVDGNLQRSNKTSIPNLTIGRGPRAFSRGQEQLRHNGTVWKARKHPAQGRCVSLDFPVHSTHQELQFAPTRVVW